MAVVFIPRALEPKLGGAKSIEVEGATVRELLEAIDRLHPGFSANLLDDGRLRSNLAVAVDGVVSPMGLREKTPGDAEVHFVPALAGGAFCQE